MNKVHDYGGVRDNQLRTLEHLGLFRVNWASEARNVLREEATAKGMSAKEIDAYVERRQELADGKQPLVPWQLFERRQGSPHA